MTHKADTSFFNSKRHWSERKDRILGEYITAYLPKIATQQHPILIVDGFAGPGKFRDGQHGSPLILAQAISKAQVRVPVRLLCVERDAELYQSLQQNLAPYSFAEALAGSFSDNIDTIANAGRDHSVFLYADPYTMEGLTWHELERVFANLRGPRMSVELLLNFNAATFLRAGLAALQQTIPLPDPSEEETDSDQKLHDDPPSIKRLDDVLATTEWRDVAISPEPFANKVAQINDLLINKLRGCFNEVCFHPMLAAPHHSVPKYFLVFASRHPDALQLMNDAMSKSLKQLAAMAGSRDEMLFEIRPERLVPDSQGLKQFILDLASTPIERKKLMLSIIRQEFGRFLWSEIRGAIESLLKSGHLQSATGKVRINDSVQIWRTRS